MDEFLHVLESKFERPKSDMATTGRTDTSEPSLLLKNSFSRILGLRIPKSAQHLPFIRQLREKQTSI